MSIGTKILKTVVDPSYAINWGKVKVSASFYLSDLRKQGNNLRLSNPKFLLSFDCDTSADIEASLRLYKAYSNNGIFPVIAAPADIIEEGLNTFRELAQLGAIFLNHGSRYHANVNTNGEVFSTLTYSNMSETEWINDIVEGHERVQEYLGVQLKGFRTPHFGEFNTPNNLKKLYSVLIKLRYNHSSSTTPLFASLAHRSQKWSSNSITEFPVNGLLEKPSQIIDSWSFSKAGSNTSSQIKSIINSLKQYQQLLQSGEKIFLNVYFDPAQLEQQKEICNELANFSPWAIKSYEELLLPS